MVNQKIITLVTGGNRGMGLEIVRELAQHGQQVLLGARDLAKGQAAAATLQQENLDVTAVALDVTNPDSVSQAVAEIKRTYGYLTVLINNAGAVFDARQLPSEVDQSKLHADFDLNYFGLIDVTQKLLPLLKLAEQAKIINISSMMGSLTEALNPESAVSRAIAVGYQSAKAAANMFTVQLAKELQRAGVPVTVNAIDPGMVATHFGGVTPEMAQKMGANPVSAGVARTVELATDFTNLATGTFSNSDGPVAW